MDTKEQLAPVQHQQQQQQSVARSPRRGPLALTAGVLLTLAIAVGIGATQGTAPTPRSAQTTISVAAGRTQPATLIHRISMRPTVVSVPAGHTQPATLIHRISMR
jgi:hypothetical protein